MWRKKLLKLPQKKWVRKLVKWWQKKALTKFNKFCERVRHRMQKRNFRKLCKTECQNICIKGRSVERRYVETKSKFSKRNFISSSKKKFTFIYRSFRSPQCSGHHNILRKLNTSKSIWIPHWLFQEITKLNERVGQNSPPEIEIIFMTGITLFLHWFHIWG